MFKSVGDLVAGCIRGDDRARALLFAEYHGLVKRAAARKLGEISSELPLRAEVEDIAHEVFVRLFSNGCEALSRLQKPESINAWLVVIARNYTVDYARKWSSRVRVQTLSASEPPEHTAYRSPADAVLNDERQSLVAKRLSELAPSDRLVLDLYFLQGHTYAELADILGMNINTVSSRLRRAKEKLRALLTEDENELQSKQ